jgi:hypothetical protein
MHLNDETLYAYLDRELTTAERARCGEHLAKCSDCQSRLEALGQRSARVAAHLAALDPAPSEAPRPARQAYLTLRQRLITKETNPMLRFLNSRFWRPVLAAITLIAVLAIALTFQPVRALASSFLGLFRVQQVTVLPLDMAGSRGALDNPQMSEAIGKLFSENFNYTREMQTPQEVADVAEASQKAGFSPRLPANQTAAGLLVYQGPAFEFTINRANAQEILDSADRSDLKLPAELDNAHISVDIPAAVQAGFGKCEKEGNKHQSVLFSGKDCLLLTQLPSPVVKTPDTLDPSALAQIGLQFTGMSAEEAARISQTIDWTTTLVIPVPRGQVENKPVSVDGVQGYLFERPKSDDPDEQFSAYTLIWVKNGIVYTVFGMGDSQKALDLANTLQ